MSCNWEFTTLGAISNNISDTFELKHHEQVVFVNTGDVLEGKFLHSRYTKKTDLPGQAKKKIKLNDILLSEIRPANRRYAFVNFDANELIVSTKFMVIRANEKVHQKFLYHLITSREMLNQFQAIAESRSGTFPQITFESISYLPINLPPLEIQYKIADFIDCIDNKIELNCQMCKKLEDIASTLFKSWFIDFDPVKAKAAGRKPEGLSPEIADLFPDSFVDSPLGQIPKGWKIGKVKDVAQQIKTTITPFKYNDEEFRHYSIPSYDKDKFPAHDLGSFVKSNKTIISPNSVLLSKLNPEIPRVWLPQKDGRLRLICSTEFLAFEPRGCFSREYLYCLFLESSFRSRLQGLVTGTSKSHQRVQPTALLNIDCVEPSNIILNEFKNVIKDVFDKIHLMKHQTKTFTNTRNYLLPKLIDGRIKMKEAEVMVSSVR